MATDSGAALVVKGYGQVEPNRLTSIVTADMESQAPAYESAAASADPIAKLENGMFLCVVPDTNNIGKHHSGRIAILPADANAMPYMVFTERKIYDERKTVSEFVDKAEDHVGGVIIPRLIGMVADSTVFTTNCVNEAESALSVGTILYIGANGYLTKTAGTNKKFQFHVLAVTTMPDGQPAVKVMCKNYVTTTVTVNAKGANA